MVLRKSFLTMQRPRVWSKYTVELLKSSHGNTKTLVEPIPLPLSLSFKYNGSRMAASIRERKPRWNSPLGVMFIRRKGLGTTTGP